MRTINSRQPVSGEQALICEDRGPCKQKCTYTCVQSIFINYVKGRTIFDAVRTIEDIMEFSKKDSID